MYLLTLLYRDKSILSNEGFYVNRFRLVHEFYKRLPDPGRRFFFTLGSIKFLAQQAELALSLICNATKNMTKGQLFSGLGLTHRQLDRCMRWKACKIQAVCKQRAVRQVDGAV